MHHFIADFLFVETQNNIFYYYIFPQKNTEGTSLESFQLTWFLQKMSSKKIDFPTQSYEMSLR